MSCGKLPSKKDFDKLEDRIKKLERDYIPKSDRKNIIKEGALGGKALILPLLGTLGIGEMAVLRKRIFDAQSQVAKVSKEVIKSKKASGQAFKDAGKALKAAGNAYKRSDKAFGSAKKAAKVAEKAANAANKLSPLLKLLPILGVLLAVGASLAVIKVLGNRMDALERGIDSQNNAISKNLGYISNLQSQIKTLGGKLDSYFNEVQKARDDAYQAFLKSTGLQSSVSQLQKNISNIWQHISSLTRTTKSNTSRINNSETLVKDLPKFKKNIQYTAKLALETAREAITDAHKALLKKAIPGVDGKPGRDGRDGQPGRDGRPGRDGINGLRGIPGIPGRNGFNGKPGINGLNGKPGLNGKDGKPGLDGKNGINGLKGEPGARGPRGIPGLPGAAGKNGLNGLNGLNGKNGLNGRDLVPDAQMKAQMNRIESKVNANAKSISNNGGSIKGNGNAIKKGFSDTQEKFKKLSKRLKLPEIINALTLIVALHNAAMLSKNLVETLGDILSQGLALIGLKDEDGNPHDINGILGKQVNTWMEQLLGKTVWENAVLKWKAANRVYQAGANMVWSVRSMFDSALTIATITAENTGRIGNALLKDRVISPNAFPNMSENVNPYNKQLERLNNLDDAASALGTIIGETTSLVSEINELKEQKTEFDKGLKELEPKEAIENQPIKAKRDAEKLASTASNDLGNVDLAEGESPN